MGICLGIRWIEAVSWLPGLAVCTTTHCAFQTESKSSDGAKINRWRQDHHYQALTKVRVCVGKVALWRPQMVIRDLNSNRQLLLRKRKKKGNHELPGTGFLVPEWRLESTRQSHSDSEVYNSGDAIEKKGSIVRHLCLTTMWQWSLTKPPANAMATVWSLRQRHGLAFLSRPQNKWLMNTGDGRL